MRGPTIFGGYWNRPADDQPFLADGWLDTGDLGRIDADGLMWVTGRANELIKRGGHGIEPSVIEDALIAHESVALAAAVGKPDAYAGELPVVYVQLHPNRTADLKILLAFAAGRIRERAAIPNEIFVLPSLPVTAVGKVHKQTLKADVTSRAVRDLLAQRLGLGSASVEVEQHPLHGLVADVRVPVDQDETVFEALGTLPVKVVVES